MSVAPAKAPATPTVTPAREATRDRRGDDTRSVKTISEERAMPAPDRPRVRKVVEAEFAENDRRSAECYSSMEMFSHQFRKLAARLEGDASVSITIDDDDDEEHVAGALDTLRGKVKTPDK